jgi:hypothetical protein
MNELNAADRAGARIEDGVRALEVGEGAELLRDRPDASASHRVSAATTQRLR